MELIDTHAHLDFPDFSADLPQVIERAAAADVTRIITIGTDLESSRRALELSTRFPSVRAAVGWHPCHAAEAPEDLRPQLRDLSRHPRVAAIGETGLDYARLPEGAAGARLREKQRNLFLQQLEIAVETGLPCVIHQRQALDEIIEHLKPLAGKVRAVFHCFVDDAAAMRRVLDLGGLVSFTGIATFKNGANVRATAAATPLDRLMVETDCPYLAPAPHRGRRCEPAHARATAAAVAEAKGCALEALAEITTRTARGFFRGLE